MNEQIKKQRILIVDDAPENIDALVDVLSDYKKSVATNGEKALQIAFSDNPPDLILLDILMPGIDGYEVCERIKRDPKTKDIPIIFITGVEEVLQKNLGYQLGCADYITKPFEILEIKTKVKTHLSLVFFKKENARLKEKIQNRKNS